VYPIRSNFAYKVFLNELLFLIHIPVIVGFSLLALRQGRCALTAFIALQGVFANLFVVKQMNLFGFAVTCSDMYAVGGILSLNLLQEYFGKQAAQDAVKISLAALVFFAVMSHIHLAYLPLQGEMTHEAFKIILGSSFRIAGASLLAFYLVQQADVRLFGLLKGALAFRVSISLLCSQTLDTVLFSFLGLYGIVDSIGSVILLSLLIKYIVVGISAPFVIFSKGVVKNVPV
jgi:uncharacterized integral membrane protein (TIGR00697 family)